MASTATTRALALLNGATDYPGNKKRGRLPPIGWGEFQDVAITDHTNHLYRFLQCWPPATSNGVGQIVHFEQRLSSFTACAVTYQDATTIYLSSKLETGSRQQAHVTGWH